MPDRCTCPAWPTPHLREHGCPPPDPLTDLAEKAKRTITGPWHTAYELTLDGEFLEPDAAYIAALSPDRFLALVERVRELERTDA
jgi:hypothetical protein